MMQGETIIQFPQPLVRKQDMFVSRGGMDIVVRQATDIPGWLEVFPARGRTREILDIRERSLVLVANLTQDIRGFSAPRIKRVGTRLLVEKARGVRVDEMVDNDSDVFYEIPTRKKIEALIIYLEALVAINKSGEMVHDHNSDGLFIEYNSQAMEITLWLVDPGDVGKGKIVTPDEASLGEARKTNGIFNTVEQIFTRDLERDCMPPSLRNMDESEIHTIVDLLKVAKSSLSDNLDIPERYRKMLQGLHLRKKEENQMTFSKWEIMKGGMLAEFHRIASSGDSREARVKLLEIFQLGIQHADVIDEHRLQDIDRWEMDVIHSDDPEIMLAVGRVISQDIENPDLSKVKTSRDFYQMLLDFISKVDVTTVFSETRSRVYAITDYWKE